VRADNLVVDAARTLANTLGIRSSCGNGRRRERSDELISRGRVRKALHNATAPIFLASSGGRFWKPDSDAIPQPRRSGDHHRTRGRSAVDYRSKGPRSVIRRWESIAARGCSHDPIAASPYVYGFSATAPASGSSFKFYLHILLQRELFRCLPVLCSALTSLRGAASGASGTAMAIEARVQQPQPPESQLQDDRACAEE
jgi:hypothetical protein